MKKKLLSALSMVMVLLMVVSTFAVAVSAAGDTVRVPAPEVTELRATCTSVTIKWEEHNDSDMTFLVYRSATGKAGTWKKLAQTKAGATSYTDKTVAPGVTYVYTVKAYLVYDGTTYLSDMSGKHTITTGLEKPVFSLCGNGGYGVVMKWDARSDASGFIIYKSTTGKAGSWSRLKVVNSGKAGSYTDTEVEIGKTYYYCIKATKTIGGKTYASPASKAYKMVIMDVAVPQNLKAVARTDSVVFSFDKVLGTAGYLIYRSETGAAGTWTKIHTTKSNNDTAFSDTTAEEGKIYYYTVKSYKKVNGEYTYSASAPKVRVTNLAVVPEITFEPSKITFNDYFETIKVNLTIKNMDEDDNVVVSIDGNRITDDVLNNEEKLAALTEKLSFIYTVDEKASTDDTLVLEIIRLQPGEGTLKVEHSRYSDIYAELKVSCPEVSYDKDAEKINSDLELGIEAALQAENLLNDAKDTDDKTALLDNAKKQLSAAKGYLDSAKSLNDSYKADYEKYETYKALTKIIDDYADAVADALEDVSGETITDSNIKDAIRELATFLEET